MGNEQQKLEKKTELSNSAILLPLDADENKSSSVSQDILVVELCKCGCGLKATQRNWYIGHWNKGIHRSEKSKKAVSRFFKGKSYEEIMGKEKAIQRKKHQIEKTTGLKRSIETIRKIAEWNLGKKRSKEGCENIRKGVMKLLAKRPELHINRRLAKMNKVSFPQQKMFDRIKLELPTIVEMNGRVKCIGATYFPDVLCREIKVGFEYDGEYWHKDKYKDEQRDLKIFLDTGVTILRFNKDNIHTLDKILWEFETGRR